MLKAGEKGLKLFVSKLDSIFVFKAATKKK